jgi:hypothetical protein
MELDGGFFDGGSDIDPSDLARGEVTNTNESVDAALRKFRWSSQIIGCIVLRLSADNRRVIGGEFVVRGDFENREWRIEAA